MCPRPFADLVGRAAGNAFGDAKGQYLATTLAHFDDSALTDRARRDFGDDRGIPFPSLAHECPAVSGAADVSPTVGLVRPEPPHRRAFRRNAHRGLVYGPFGVQRQAQQIGAAGGALREHGRAVKLKADGLPGHWPACEHREHHPEYAVLRTDPFDRGRLTMSGNPRGRSLSRHHSTLDHTRTGTREKLQ